MIGGEAAEQSALARRPVADGQVPEARDAYGLGWVVDWLYGDAVLPPMPLPAVTDSVPLRPRTPAPVRADGPIPPRPRPGARPRKRRDRQLALL